MSGKKKIRLNRVGEHLLSDQHVKAAKGLSALDSTAQKQTTIENCIANLRQSFKNQDIKTNFAELYFIAKNNLPLNILESENNLHTIVEMSGGRIHSSYRSRKQGSEILSCISDCIKEDCLRDVALAPFVSIKIDESSDVSKATQLVICLRYIKRSSIEQRFFEICEILNPNATEIHARVAKFLQDWDFIEETDCFCKRWSCGCCIQSEWCIW